MGGPGQPPEEAETQAINSGRVEVKGAARLGREGAWALSELGGKAGCGPRVNNGSLSRRAPEAPTQRAAAAKAPASQRTWGMALVWERAQSSH